MRSIPKVIKVWLVCFLGILGIYISYQVGRNDGWTRTEYCLGYIHVVDSNYPYLCDGTNDANVINRAVANGRNIALEGNFRLMESIILQKSDTRIVGIHQPTLTLVDGEFVIGNNDPNFDAQNIYIGNLCFEFEE